MNKQNTEQIRSDSFSLITKFGQGNFRQVAKHCFELSPLTYHRSPPTSLCCLQLLSLTFFKENSLLALLFSHCYIFYFIIYCLL